MNDLKNLTPHHKDNPFTVPDGYFDSLTSKVMDAIPANEVQMMTKPQKHFSRWRGYAAAASIVAALFGAGIYFYQNGEGTQNMSSTSNNNTVATYSSPDSNIDAVADYIMCDEQDFYAYLSGE